jgi:CIC family chloride channel protein
MPRPAPGEKARAPRVRSFSAVGVWKPVRRVVGLINPAEQPLELQIAGRTLLHAALVGLGAGILGCAFFACAELVQNLLLERLAAYEPLRAHGEKVWGATASGQLRLWLLVAIPTIGALIGGLVCRFAPECRGGGGDATIDAFHHEQGVVRRRVLWVKPLASIATLGAGGSGGREGPTMHIGAALGSLIGRYLGVTPRERRVLMVAGIAAGISAVFRAPLGAALIAIEMLYRDDFESEALIPSVLASVIAYSVSISVFGQSTLFGHLPPYAFHPDQIPLYIGLAIVVSAAASTFVASLRFAQKLFDRADVPDWVRPALGGLSLGILVVLTLHVVGPVIGRADRGLGILGGGYGVSQVAITGADWLPMGWTAVEVLALLALVKIVASSVTIGSGGSAGDFAPALAIGGLLGGAFGIAARVILHDPTIQPGAFALVGMGTFYGGIANTPLAALVLVCEMAGSYELLVPLMLAEGLAVIVLRKVSLYPAQLATLRDSPVHRREVDPLANARCADVLRRDRTFVTLAPETPIRDLLQQVELAGPQGIFPVVDDARRLRGLISDEALRLAVANPELHLVGVAADLMTPAVSVPQDADLRTTAQLLVSNDLRGLPVVDDERRVIGILDEHDLSSVMLD